MVCNFLYLIWFGDQTNFVAVKCFKRCQNMAKKYKKLFKISTSVKNVRKCEVCRNYKRYEIKKCQEVSKMPRTVNKVKKCKNVKILIHTTVSVKDVKNWQKFQKLTKKKSVKI